jgi:ORF6N domain
MAHEQACLEPVPSLVPEELIERRIYLIRTQKVMLDADLAELYDVETKALNQAVKRNPERFPPDFMFPPDESEAEAPGSMAAAAIVLMPSPNTG